MGGINIAGVMKGGLAAALIMNISEFILNVPVPVRRWRGAGRSQPAAGRAAADRVFMALTRCSASLPSWLYAAIRPRFGPGPKTAICAGLTVWALSYVYSGHHFGGIGIDGHSSS